MINQSYIYVGNYDHRLDGEGNEHSHIPHGIHRLKLDSMKKCITYDKTFENVDNPSFLILDRAQRYLYAANETAMFKEKDGGSISVFLINQQNGDLEFIQQIGTLGAHPCHLSISFDGVYLVASNYSGGNVICYEILSNGMLEQKGLLAHEGSSVNKERQGEPHPHSTQFLRDKNTFLALDLGIDQLVAYDIKETGDVLQNQDKTIVAQPGVGPRHSVHHTKLEILYVINELSSTVSVLKAGDKDGIFHEIQSIATNGYLPGEEHVVMENSKMDDNSENIENTGADIHITQDGKLLYASNRGEDSIVCFSINQEDGTLVPCRSISSGGQCPRNFMIDPLENFMIVANQGSNQVVLFEINKETGVLTELQKLDIPKPVCVVPLK